MNAHSVPLHCPYCGGEFLFPHGDSHGAWECRECLRAFSVKFLGLLANRASSPSITSHSSADHPVGHPTSTGDQPLLGEWQ